MLDWLIVGLGNPGVRYAKTRHNLGFLAVYELARKLGSEASGQIRLQTRWQAEVLKIDACATDGKEKRAVRLHLFLPMTYMNCCGPAIERYRKFYNIPLSQMVILVDDIALPFGEVRYREKGSAGGHNGLKSIEQALGTREYRRLRMGVGAPPGTQDLADYVLSPFSEEEWQHVPSLLKVVSEWLLALPLKNEKQGQSS